MFTQAYSSEYLTHVFAGRPTLQLVRNLRSELLQDFAEAGLVPEKCEPCPEDVAVRSGRCAVSLTTAYASANGR